MSKQILVFINLMLMMGLFLPGPVCTAMAPAQPAMVCEAADDRVANCPALTEDLNTGRDQFAGEILIRAGQPDDEWQVLTELPGRTPVVESATVVNALATWPSAPDGTRWISAISMGPGPGVPEQAVFRAYRKSFCMNEGFGSARISMDLFSSEGVVVFLNGRPIGGSGAATSAGEPVHIESTDPRVFQAGTNTLSIEGVSPSGRPAGVNVAGTVTAENGFCCIGAPGTIQGRKWNDQNSDGVRDSQEPGLSGWSIQARNSAGMLAGSTTTDASGDYSMSLVAGQYTISETSQPGFAQTFPPVPGAHVVPLPAGGVIAHRNFGSVAATGLPDLATPLPPEVVTVPPNHLHFFTTFRIVNRGTAPINAKVKHQVWLIRLGEDSPGEVIATVITDAPLGAGAFQDFKISFEIPEEVGEADYLIRIVADSEDVIQESNEKNNEVFSLSFRP